MNNSSKLVKQEHVDQVIAAIVASASIRDDGVIDSLNDTLRILTGSKTK